MGYIKVWAEFLLMESFFPPKNFGEFRSILVKEVVTLTYQAFPDCLVHICFKYVLFNANIYWYKCEN